MEIVKITPSQNTLWEQVWHLYTESFPEYERRRTGSHSLAAGDKDFHTYIAMENGSLLALLFYWTYKDMLFIEHLAVVPAMRGRNIGTSLIRLLIGQNEGCKVILEIDPPVDEQSIRRLAFYESLGFKLNDYYYTHPSYCSGGHEHELRIMSYPNVISREEFELFREFVNSKILKYID